MTFVALAIASLVVTAQQDWIEVTTGQNVTDDVSFIGPLADTNELWLGTNGGEVYRSFDKGIYVHIPFEWGLPFYSQSAYDLILHSLTRDGGQRLDNDDSLYDETDPTSFDEMARHIDEITTP